MRSMKWLVVCTLGIVAGCSSKNKEIARIIESPIEYHSHLSPYADMSRYHTWNWLSPLVDSTSVEKEQLEKGMRDAIESAVEFRMKDRGYERDISSPDLVVNYHVASKDIDADYMRKMYDGKYDPKYRQNFDGPRRARDTWTEGSIILFAFDASSGDLVWRSSAKAEVTGEAPLDERVKRVDSAIKMMFTSLPGK